MMQQREILRDTQAINCELYELTNTQANNFRIYMARHLSLSILSLQLQEQLHNMKNIQNKSDTRLGGPL